MDILVKALQLILSLSILVIFHEFGHFFFARLFKCRVEKFYLFFDPWFALYKRKVGETEYGIGWLPLGGYVKIAGMLDESLDKAQLQKDPQPWEFRTKPAWQRLLIMIGGVLVNFILAFLLFSMSLFVWGEKYLPTQNVKYGIMCDSLGIEMGLQNGDKIVKVNDKEIDNFKSIIPEILLNDPKKITVNRNGEQKEIFVGNDMISKIIEQGSFFDARIPFVVSRFAQESVAEKSGLLKGDKIVKLNGQEVLFFDQFKNLIENYKNQEVTITVERDNKELIFPMTISQEGVIGVYPKTSYSDFFELKNKEYSIIGAIPAGFSKGYNEIANYLKQFKLIFSPETGAYKSVGGFIAIGNIFPSEWDWQIFWHWTALLSIMLAVVNILPIPALDGGHVLFLFYEIITRRKPSEKFMEYAQMMGMALLFGLIIFANGNDIMKLIFK